MQIEYVELRNIKSYQQSKRILFSEGINAISGENGAGKSTLLEAIGYALFDARNLKVEHYIREGEKSGEIIVGFTDSLDQRAYEVVRPVPAGSGQPYIYDPEIKRRLVSGKTDVYDWIREHFQVSSSTELNILFSDAIGVPQGLLTAIFQEAKATRKAKFDPLLQVGEYEKAWSQLRDTARDLGKLVSKEIEQIARLEGELKQLPGLQKEEKDLLKEIDQIQKELQAETTDLENIEVEKKTLDDAALQLNVLENQIGITKSKLEELQHKIGEADSDVAQAANASKIIEESKAGYEAYEDAQTLLRQLDEQRKERDPLEKQKNIIEGNLALADQKITFDKKKLEGITAAETKMESLTPEVEKQETLRKELEDINVFISKKLRVDERIQEKLKEFEKLNSCLIEIQAEVEQRGLREIKIINLEGEDKALGEMQTQLTIEATRIEQNIQQLEERLQVLGTTDSSECPVCQKPLSVEEAKTLQNQFIDELDYYKTLLRETANKKLETSDAIKEIDRKIQGLRKDLYKLARPEKQEELVQEITERKKVLEGLQQELRSYDGVENKQKKLKESLTLLGDPLSRYTILKSQVEERPEIEIQINAGNAKLTGLEASRKIILESLKKFKDVDKRVEETQVQSKQYQCVHDLYLQNLKTAQEFAQRKDRLDAAQKDYKSQDEKKTRYEQEKAKVSQVYDVSKHQLVTQKQKEHNNKRVELTTKAEEKQHRLEQVKQQIDELLPLKVELQRHQEEEQFLDRLKDDLEFVRNTIREAGPLIIRRLVQTISEEANRIFTDILNNHTYRLNWSEDYEITVEHLGNTRDFSQLSGGEKMSAALAVRLALLRELSEIRIAFFAYPTAHLDGIRRENLAEQITNIKGFQQLFVISHDDTFERQTHNVLHVSKENGISCVEVGV